MEEAADVVWKPNTLPEEPSELRKPVKDNLDSSRHVAAEGPPHS